MKKWKKSTAETVEKHFSVLRTTILGGVFFLLPVVLLIVFLGKAYNIMMMVAEPVANFLPLESVAGIALVNLVALLALFLVCLLAGLTAKSAPGQRLFSSIDQKFLLIPGYAIFKGRLSGNIGATQDDEGISLKPVLVTLGPKEQVGMQVEELDDGRVVVFLPTAPEPWSGSVVIVKAEQVVSIEQASADVMHTFELLGHGTAELFRPDKPT